MQHPIDRAFEMLIEVIVPGIFLVAVASGGAFALKAFVHFLIY